MDAANRRRLSKFLSLVLRHQPELIALRLDAHGWATVADLLAGCSAQGVTMTRAELNEIVATNDKRRFAFSPDGLCIRAQQGHTVDVDLGLMPTAPPEHLYHGTVARFLDAIRREGLCRGQRHHVHLSPDRATAQRVGQRRGRPVVLSVDAGRMHRDGHLFYHTANGVWLTDAVPARYLHELGEER